MEIKPYDFFELSANMSFADEPDGNIYFYPPAPDAFLENEHYIEKQVGKITVRFYNPENTFEQIAKKTVISKPTISRPLQNYCKKKGLHLFIAELVNPYDVDADNNWPYIDMTVVITPREKPVFYASTTSCGPGFWFDPKNKPELMLEIQTCDGMKTDVAQRKIYYFSTFFVDEASYEVSEKETYILNDTFPQKSMNENEDIIEELPTGDHWIALNDENFAVRIITAMELLAKGSTYLKETYGTEDFPLIVYPD